MHPSSTCWALSHPAGLTLGIKLNHSYLTSSHSSHLPQELYSQIPAMQGHSWQTSPEPSWIHTVLSQVSLTVWPHPPAAEVTHPWIKEDQLYAPPETSLYTFMTPSHWCLILTLGCYSAEITTSCILYFLWDLAICSVLCQFINRKKSVWIMIINSFLIKYWFFKMAVSGQ